MPPTPTRRRRVWPARRAVVGALGYGPPRRWPQLAAETTPGYTTQPLPTELDGAPAPEAPQVAAPAPASGAAPAGAAKAVSAVLAQVAAAEAQLAGAVERLAAVPVDELDEAAIAGQLGVIEQAARQLEARRCRLASGLAARRTDRARQQAADNGQDAARAAQRARKQLEHELAETHQWSKADTKQTLEVGGQLGTNEQTQAAFDAGELSPRHARLLAETLKDLDDPERAQASHTLVAAAAGQDAHTFGRTCRRLLAELDGPAAMRAENRRYTRRRAAVHPTDDGMLSVSGQWAGLDAELLATAIDAFRTPDAPGLHRRAEQRTADALVDLARAALRTGEAPTDHGIRPHVTITIDYHTILADTATAEQSKHTAVQGEHTATAVQGEHTAVQGERAAAGVVETTWLGPLPFAEIRRLLSDAGVARLLIDPNGVPLEAGEDVRTVPAGLWRALQARDQGCIADGCDTPAAWCDVMHLDRPYRLNGRLTLDTAGLGCRHHHRCLDLNNWHVNWHNRRPTIRPPT